MAHISSNLPHRRLSLGFDFYHPDPQWLPAPIQSQFYQYQIKSQPYEQTINILAHQLKTSPICAFYLINISLISYGNIKQGRMF